MFSIFLLKKKVPWPSFSVALMAAGSLIQHKPPRLLIIGVYIYIITATNTI
jgi:hypothetical protein